VELTNREYALPTISRTFEGRDRFAPAAAWLARGADLATFGPHLTSMQRLDVPEPRVDAGEIVGEVLRVDRFGNLITNIDRASLGGLPGVVSIGIGGRHVEGIVAAYAAVRHGTLCAVVGSTDRLEIAVNGASASELLSLGRGAPVRLRSGA
jgi:S-adenosyl-L-methionine hydrolase (adenosine-forming)